MVEARQDLKTVSSSQIKWDAFLPTKWGALPTKWGALPTKWGALPTKW